MADDVGNGRAVVSNASGYMTVTASELPGMNRLTVQERTVYQLGKRPRREWEACAGSLLVCTAKTAAEAKREAIAMAVQVLGNSYNFRAYRFEETSYFVHANANGGFTIETVHDSPELEHRGTSSNSCTVYGPERSFADVCRTVEARIEDLRNPTAWATCGACGYPTFAPNKVDPIPERCGNPACGAALEGAA